LYNSPPPILRGSSSTAEGEVRLDGALLISREGYQKGFGREIFTFPEAGGCCCLFIFLSSWQKILSLKL